ncbi:NnrS family protein [Labrys sedimenti]|uniref:NnrS family protein n=1 Tax=Labrys sedimenti TaxID=3106036 RepID=UPI002ACAE234|nr:NnrS family protein [Labrys sp. ZIDIC5]MDZ5454345.1 NnrS family protein [Labrys sp. ZIDIC5]
MTLAMMSRATVGHTGRVLEASPATQLIYLAVVVAVALRVAMEFVPNLSVPMMHALPLPGSLHSRASQRYMDQCLRDHHVESRSG